MPDETKDDQTVTISGIEKTWPIFTGAVTLIVSLVWFGAGIKTDVAEIRIEQTSLRDVVQSMKDQNEKRFGDDESVQRLSNQNISDIQRKLDVAVTILQRIDQKTGKE